jgi:hypothetical protein
MEERPLKKSEVLAIENIKRIADQIRSERNDALALAQEKREQVELAITSLKDIKSLLSQSADVPTVIAKIDALLSRLARE